MRVLKALVAAGIVTLASSVSASPIVTVWSYTASASFDTASTVWDPPGAPASGGPVTNTSNLLAWGIPDNAFNTQSSLEITNSPNTNMAKPVGPNPGGQLVTAVGGLPTYDQGEIGLTNTFNHHNFTLALGSNTLDSVTVNADVTLTPFAPPGAPKVFPTIPFPVNFKETLNPAPNHCADNDPNPCPDIFVTLGGLNLPFWFNTDNGDLQFSDPGDPANYNKYFASIFAFPDLGGSPLLDLSPEACAVAGAQPGCRGFKTQEQQDNFVNFAFSITTEPIGLPEPGVLALFAVALVGLGFTVRRRSA